MMTLYTHIFGQTDSMYQAMCLQTEDWAKAEWNKNKKYV